MQACTIVASNYLAQARVLAQSFLQHHPGARFAILLVDDTAGEHQPPDRVELLRLTDIGLEPAEEYRMPVIYDVTELSTAVKPWLLRHMQQTGTPEVIYFDPDIQIFTRLDDITDLARQHSIVLAPHVTEPIPRDGLRPTETDILGAGMYNLGFIAIGAGSEAFLDWWAVRLKREAVIDPPRMRFTDQRWIDFVPGLFRSHILRDRGCDVAYWNLHTRRLSWTGSRYEVDGEPLRFFHFSGYHPEAPDVLSKFMEDKPRIVLSENPALAKIFGEYGEKLMAAGFGEASTTPYGYASFAGTVKIDACMRRIYREALARFEDGETAEPPSPFAPDGAEAFLDWLNKPVRAQHPIITRYMLGLHECQRDLQTDFPDPLGPDAVAFHEWFIDEVQRGEGPHPLLRPPDAVAIEPLRERDAALRSAQDRLAADNSVPLADSNPEAAAGGTGPELVTPESAPDSEEDAASPIIVAPVEPTAEIEADAFMPPLVAVADSGPELDDAATISSPSPGPPPRIPDARWRSMRIAFVVQRCGSEVNGGAELHCLQVAQRLSSHVTTEVLTTCALDYTTWENFYPAGVESNGGTLIRRFPVDEPRNRDAFNRLSAELHERQACTSLEEQEEWMRAQGPMSSALLRYIGSEKENYDAFVFFGYLYATTYFGLPLVQEKAYLAPLAHDEWPIYFAMWERIFAMPRQLIYNTAVEREFVERRFPALSLTGTVAAVGIEAPSDVDREAFAIRHGLRGPFLLYVGRIDEAKGCQTLFDYFTRARAEELIQHKLVLIGREAMPVPVHDDIIYLGFVSERERWEAMAACDWLVVPSPHESLSLVLLEAWSMGRPALVNGECDVLTQQCRRANGGLWYDSYDDWVAVLRNVTAPQKRRLAEQGTAFVTEEYSWDRVENDYLAILSAARSNTADARV
ncbi:MAG: hypothetical protein AVDCRST_MAG42-2116 [uncultured Chthoniobacterales bacterium]|uniref:Uncharacterized protein n=1 Tax=uncultured Chthoniobacterales bacterium TaxID=1836801 RepID=A0A6J4I837_9BACT|nr:MAG: hypothetical protein AVDCRST_MAG42-2116 [uncultured Chthoniobacterales bacterium]